MFSSISIYIRWWKTWQSLPVWHWVRAAGHFRAGQYGLAEELYQRGLNERHAHPAVNSARIDRSYCLFKLRRIGEAQDQLRAVLIDLPDSRDTYLRLARLQLWAGQALDAAWTVRRALQSCKIDSDFVAILLVAMVESGAPSFLVRETEDLLDELAEERRSDPLLQAGLARLALYRCPDDQQSFARLEQLATAENAPFEAVLLLAEVLLQRDETQRARQHLRRAMAATADHPRLLSLLAEVYLKSGDSYNPGYAKQLATSACQSTEWISPRELHILAETYYHLGDNISALIIASKAKEAGSRLLGSYRGVKNLERLIENLSEGTQA